MSYDARKKELMEEVEKKAFEPAVKDAVTNALNSYFAQREGRLDNLLELLNPSEENVFPKWLEKAKESSTAAQDALGKVEPAKFWMADVSNDEYTFFFHLSLSQIAVKRDVMVQQTLALKKAEKEFDDKWKTIKDADAAVEDRMKAIGKEYGEILDSAASVAATVQKESKEVLADKIRQILTLGLGAVDLGIVEKLIQGAASAIGIKISEVESRKLEIHALISREEGIFATFKEGREMVKKFLEETSYPRIKDAWDGATAASKDLAGRMRTNGQRDDINAFASAVDNKLKDVFAKAEESYKAFAKKHEFLFFGPLGGGYYTELLEDDFWKEKSDRWKKSKHDIDDLLRERNLEASESKILEVSLEGMKGEDKYRAYEILKASCQELLKTWNKFKEMTNNPEWALESRETLKRVLDAMK